MPRPTYTIWCNASFTPGALEMFRNGVQHHRLIFPEAVQTSILSAGSHDPLLDTADIAFGQPDATQICTVASLKWIQLTTAGYTRYDRDDVKAALRARGAMLTNSSSVYAEPCAEHLVAMLLSMARQLPQCLLEQQGDRAWRTVLYRERTHLLRGQTAIMLGFGAIGRRIEELLRPLGMKLYAMRRSPSGSEPITTIPESQLNDLLPHCDHLINILPDSASTRLFVNADRLGRLKPAAYFYNIGRGTTVDQDALVNALKQSRLAGAYLDVTDPEPLPVDHPLWSAPNCFITPHTAGGHADEFDRLVRHFLDNLHSFEKSEPLVDRVI
jgi:phosphoglycerate dehydrogenase-like enzyme